MCCTTPTTAAKRGPLTFPLAGEFDAALTALGNATDPLAEIRYRVGALVADPMERSPVEDDAVPTFEDVGKLFSFLEGADAYLAELGDYLSALRDLLCDVDFARAVWGSRVANVANEWSGDALASPAPSCVECGRRWADERELWRTFLTVDNEPAHYCSECAAREFSDRMIDYYWDGTGSRCVTAHRPSRCRRIPSTPVVRSRSSD